MLKSGLLLSTGLSLGAAYLTANLYAEVADYGTLKSAWLQVRRSGLRSQSEQTRASIKAYEQAAEAGVRELSEALKAGEFCFGVARGVALPRPGKEPRPLVVAEIRDRIVQRAILETLQRQDALIAYVSRPNSFGGLPRRRRVQAISTACEAVAAGAKYFVKSDISGFFTRILRSDVLQQIAALLPDDSLSDLLDNATHLELENADALGEELNLFPDDNEGVAQGCCLSPLFGNVCLYEFDELMNAEGIVTIRYIDDFLVLGEGQGAVRRAFDEGRRWLESHNFGAYVPGDGSGKSAAGRTSRGFEFLGCTITPHVVEPSKAARANFVARIKARLDAASLSTRSRRGRVPGEYGQSLVQTLALVSRMVHAWTEQYRFCNPTDAFFSVDKHVDRLVGRYMASFFKRVRQSGMSPSERRRMLGVWLAADGSRSPILPLDRR